MSLSKKELEEFVESLVDKRVRGIKRSMVPHICFTCKWFILRKEKPINRVCRYPKDLEVQGQLCLSWELQEDPTKYASRIAGP